MIGRFFVTATLSASLAFAQTRTTPSASTSSSTTPPKGKPATFDVATIKPSHPGEGWHFGFGQTGYSAAAVTLGTVIYQAYFGFNMGGKDAVTGGPDWVNKDTWDIETKVASDDMEQYQRDNKLEIANPVTRQMLQTLLADRCKLVVHHVPAEMPGYALVLARGGPKLTEAASDEAQPAGGIPARGGGFLVPYHRGDTPHISFAAVSMSTFVQQLRGMARGPVMDRTGLTGRYDFTLTWLSLDPDEHEGAISFDDPIRSLTGISAPSDSRSSAFRFPPSTSSLITSRSPQPTKTRPRGTPAARKSAKGASATLAEDI